ncbi:MAG: non-canonical purine NTP pyrophosphatase [Nanoarchaeota archaeon]|nr:non-canonical purine NTP pyrophosphatase [Nanoarchaeota archaeon]
MNPKKVYVITRNKGKLMAAQKAFSKFGIVVEAIEKDYPEIQANNSIEIAKFTALQATKEFKVPVIREDHSLFINALGGFPGPYTNYFEKTISVEKLLEMLKDCDDRTGHFEIAAAFAKPNGHIKEFVFKVPIKIFSEKKGEKGNWDKVLMLADEDVTFSEVTEESRLHVWNKNYIAIAEDMLKEE